MPTPPQTGGPGGGPGGGSEGDSTGIWEVDLVATPEVQVEEGEVDGVFLVVEADSGLVRLVDVLAPGAELGHRLLRAAATPMAGEAGPPVEVRVRAAMAQALRGATEELGAALQLVRSLPAVDQAAASLVAFLSQGPQQVGEPQTVHDAEVWRPLLVGLVDAAPWEVVSGDTVFQFQGGALDGRVAQLIGGGGVQRGLAVFDSEADLEATFLTADGGPPSFRAMAIHVDPTADFGEGEVARAEREDLIYQGQMLWVGRTDGAFPTPLPEADGPLLRAATEAVLQVVQSQGERLSEQQTTNLVNTPMGRGVVQTHPGGPSQPTLLDDIDHQFSLTPSADGTVVWAWKMAKRDARRLATRLDAVTALRHERQPGGWLVVAAMAGSERIGGMVALAPGPWGRIFAGDLAGRLRVLAGGAKRRTYKLSDILLERDVRLE